MTGRASVASLVLIAIAAMIVSNPGDRQNGFMLIAAAMLILGLAPEPKQ